jgi:hypothetical protein
MCLVGSVAHWRLLLTAIGIGVLLFTVAVFYKRCTTPKLDEKAIIRSQRAIEQGDKEEMKQILVESDVAEKQIDENLQTAHAEQVNAANEAKKKYEAMSNEDLAKELERRSNP